MALRAILRRLAPSILRPMALEAGNEAFPVEAYMLSETFYRPVPTFKMHEAFGASVLRLLGMCGPSAVRQAIVSIYVNSVESLVFRSLAHIAKKCREVTTPLLADSDSSSSIARIVRRVRGMAAALHAFPSAIGSSPAFAVRSIAMSSRGTATGALPRAKPTTSSGHDFSARREQNTALFAWSFHAALNGRFSPFAQEQKVISP